MHGRVRFYKEDIYELAEQMQLLVEITSFNRLVVASVPALCLDLKRYSYRYRYGNLVFDFERRIPELSIITNHRMEMIYDRWHHLYHLLSTYDHNLLSPQKFSPKHPKYREKSSRPAVLRPRQIAATNVVDFGATPLSSLMGMRSRHPTAS